MRSLATAFTLLMILVSAHGANGQEEVQFSGAVQVLSIGGPEGGLSDEGRQKLAESAISTFSPMGGGMAFGSPLGGIDPNSGSQLFSLLSNESVRQELQLAEQQYAGAQKIMQEASKRTSDYIKATMAEQKSAGGAIRIDGAAMKEIQSESRKQAELAIEEILLPAQLERIRQLAYQIEVAQTGLGEALVSGRLGTEIDVHEDQKQHLTDRAKVIEAETRVAVAKIRSDARAKLLAELAPDQRQAAENLLGAYFDYEELSLSQQIRKQMSAMRSQVKQTTSTRK